ncbi:MAG: phosphotransferase [Actinotalea sp.]|nr:phosphotransferase [Actinotalea sp.]
MTGPVWAPDVAVDERLATHLVRTQFPELAGLPVRRFAAGWDNAVFSVGPELLFRFVHRAIAVPLAARELAVLGALVGRGARGAGPLPLAVPVPRYVGRPVPEFERPFWGAARLPGMELAVARLDDGARIPLAGAVGRFLRALHAPDLRDDVLRRARQVGVELPVDPNRRGEPAAYRDRAVDRLRRLQEQGVDVDLPALIATLDLAVDVGPRTGEPVLLHGDLHLRHLLVDARGAASGVIDWGDTGLGDPAVDLMIGYAAFVGESREAFLAAYGPLQQGTAERARALAVHVCAALLDSVLADDAAALADEVIAALGRVLR